MLSCFVECGKLYSSILENKYDQIFIYSSNLKLKTDHLILTIQNNKILHRSWFTHKLWWARKPLNRFRWNRSSRKFFKQKRRFNSYNATNNYAEKTDRQTKHNYLHDIESMPMVCHKTLVEDNRHGKRCQSPRSSRMHLKLLHLVQVSVKIV